MTPTGLNTMELNDLQDLANLIRQGNVVLFVGSGVSVEAGLPSAFDIGIKLAAESQYNVAKNPADLPAVAEYYERRKGREALLSMLRRVLDGRILSREVTSYDLIAELEVFPRIVTTNWDDLIEDAFTRKEKPLVKIKSDQNVNYLREGNNFLLKLHGDLSSPSHEMVITENDYINTYSKVSTAGTRFTTLASWLQERTFLFVGYSLRDTNFRYLFNLVKKQNPTSVRHYAVMKQVDPYEKAVWERDEIRIIECTAKEFFVWLFTELRSFANRDFEIEYISNQAKMPFVEVFGPIQCGKTELLKQAEKLYQLKVPQWSTSLVQLPNTSQTGIEFDEFTAIRTLSRDILKWEITRDQLLAQIDEAVEHKARAENRLPTSVEKDQAAATEGARQLAYLFRERQVAIFLDDLDRAGTKLIRWLEEELLPLIMEQHYDPYGKVRVVFAGRSPTSWRKWFVKSRLFQLPLSPLGEAAVTDMLRATATLTIKAPLQRSTSERMVARILWLSGGHPRAIRNLLQHLAERNFDVYMGDPSGGSVDYFQQQRKSLFEGQIYPVIEPVVQSVPSELKDILHSLAAFRCFNQGILTAVLRNVHPTFESTSQDVVRTLKDKSLLQPFATSQMDAIDSMIRYILAEWLEVFDDDRFIQLNELGARQYDGWTAQMGHQFDFERWRTFVIESLFHHLVLVRKGVETVMQLSHAFTTNLNSLPRDQQDTERSISVLNQLKDTLKSDLQLFSLADSTVGMVGPEEWLQEIDECIRALTEMV